MWGPRGGGGRGSRDCQTPMLSSIASAVAAPAAAAAPPPARRRRDQDPERVFPLDFRSPLGDNEGSAGDESGPAGPPLLLRFSCACGRCTFEAEVSDDQPPVRCHCVSCRRVHTAAFAAFAPVAAVPAALGGLGQAAAGAVVGR